MIRQGKVMIKIVLVDDHDLVRSGLKALLNQRANLTVIAEASSGEKAIEIAAKHQPDVMIMDVRMPGIGGLEATRQISNSQPGIKILVLTACYNEPYPSQLIRAGAVGYLTKDTEVNEMLEAIQKLNQGEPYLSKNIAHYISQTRHHINSTDNPWDDLSDREMQVMLMLINGLTTMAIAAKLQINIKTVNSYRYRIFEKLEVQNDVELTRLAIHYNLVDSNDD